MTAPPPSTATAAAAASTEGPPSTAGVGSGAAGAAPAGRPPSVVQPSDAVLVRVRAQRAQTASPAAAPSGTGSRPRPSMRAPLGFWELWRLRVEKTGLTFWNNYHNSKRRWRWTGLLLVVILAVTIAWMAVLFYLEAQQQKPGQSFSEIDPDMLEGIAMFVAACGVLLALGAGDAIRYWQRTELNYLFPAPVPKEWLCFSRWLKGVLGVLISATLLALVVRAYLGPGFQEARGAGVAGVWLSVVLAGLFFTGLGSWLALEVEPRLSRRVNLAIISVFLVAFALLFTIAIGLHWNDGLVNWSRVFRSPWVLPFTAYPLLAIHFALLPGDLTEQLARFIALALPPGLIWARLLSARFGIHEELVAAYATPGQGLGYRSEQEVARENLPFWLPKKRGNLDTGEGLAALLAIERLRQRRRFVWWGNYLVFGLVAVGLLAMVATMVQHDPEVAFVESFLLSLAWLFISSVFGPFWIHFREFPFNPQQLWIVRSLPLEPNTLIKETLKFHLKSSLTLWGFLTLIVAGPVGYYLGPILLFLVGFTSFTLTLGLGVLSYYTKLKLAQGTKGPLLFVHPAYSVTVMGFILVTYVTLGIYWELFGLLLTNLFAALAWFLVFSLLILLVYRLYHLLPRIWETWDLREARP